MDHVLGAGAGARAPGRSLHKVSRRHRPVPAPVDRGEGQKAPEAADPPLELPQLATGKENPNFDLYVVDNLRQGDPALFQLRVLGVSTCSGR